MAGVAAGVIGFALALPALRVSGPYLAMVTIAFAFIIQHGATEWRDLTGGANGLMNLKPPALFGRTFAEREMAVLAVTARRMLPAFLLSIGKQCLGQGHGCGTRCRGGGALDRAQSGDHENGCIRVVRRVYGPRRGNLCSAVHVRCAGFVPVLSIDPFPAGGDPWRGRLGVRTCGRRRDQRRSDRSCCRAWPSIGCCSSAAFCWSCCGSRPKACSARWRDSCGAPTRHARTALASTRSVFAASDPNDQRWRSPASVSHLAGSRRQPT